MDKALRSPALGVNAHEKPGYTDNKARKLARSGTGRRVGLPD
jgi:hypothetical protein